MSHQVFWKRVEFAIDLADFVTILNESSLNGFLLFEDELPILCGKLPLDFLILFNGIN